MFGDNSTKWLIIKIPPMFTVIEEIDLTSIRVWNAAIRGISQCEHTDGDLKMLGRTSHFLILFTLLKSRYVQEKRCFVFASKTTSILRFLNDGLKGLFWLLKHFSLLIAATAHKGILSSRGAIRQTCGQVFNSFSQTLLHFTQVL